MNKDINDQCYYVYGLYDPMTFQIFYIGKGKNYRDKAHLKPSIWKEPKRTRNPFLYYKIRSLMESNNAPIIKRLHENLSETVAYDYEINLIKQYGRKFSEENGILFNLSDNKGGIKGTPKPWTDEHRISHKKFCKTRRLYDPTYKELYEEYITQNLRKKDISEKHKISIALVVKRLKFYSIKKPKILRYPTRNNFECLICKKTIIVPKSVTRKYCSKKCFDKRIIKK